MRELPSIGATAELAGRSTMFWDGMAAQALSGGIDKIWLDGRVRASLDQSVPQIGAPAAWQAGHTGRDTTVAVLDTGIDATHPDLSDAVVESLDFTGSSSGTNDMLGHGTHVASTITGNGAQYKGVAPDARLLNGKVLDDSGFGFVSWLIAGMEWAAGRGVDVINMSLGSSLPSDGTDPLSAAVNRLSRHFADRDLASVRSVHASTAPGRIGTRDQLVSAPLPFTLTEFYTPDRPWCGPGDPCGMFDVSTADGSPESYVVAATQRTYQRGRTTVEHWNAAVLGPAFPQLPDYGRARGRSWADRFGDRLCVALPLFTDQDHNRYGDSDTISRSTALFRDGQPVELAKFVSLKSSVSDADGNAVEQTIIRAYELK